MLPGKTYSIEEIVHIVARKWWLIGGLFALGVGGAWAVSHNLVNMYRSETLILVVPQRVPESYVKSTVTATIADRLPTISQQILSRSRLERVILDMNLYSEMRQSEPMEDVVQKMRLNDIDVGSDKGESSFHVSYVSQDPVTAQKVTSRLASLFIEENTRDRENQAEDTNQFLDSQLEEKRRQLLETEKKLEEYKRRFSGQLPSQATTNLQAIQTNGMTIQNLADAINRERERKLSLESQLLDLEAPDPILAVATAPTAAVPDGSTNEPVTVQLERWRARLSALETRVTADHPEVKIAKRNIEELEAKQVEELKNPPPVSPKTMTPVEISRQRRIKELKGQIESIERDLVEKQAQDRQLKKVVADYQAKLEGVPARESELVELTRDYDTMHAQYQSLLTKREDSKLAANLERRNIGEQFKVLDPARVPERPFSPKRLQIYLAGSGGGLALALLLIGLVEYRDSTLKLEGDVMRLLDLPVLALVPIIASPEDETRRKRRVVLAGVSVILALGVVAAIAAWRSPF